MPYETINIELPTDEAVKLFRLCSENRITVDELVDQFLHWCIAEPDAMKEWFEKNKHLLKARKIKRHLNMPEITEEELVEHIEDDNFLNVYGNPVIIRGKDDHPDCVLMSIEYYERITGDKVCIAMEK